MPGQSRTYGRWAKKEAIGRQTLEKYVAAFNEKIQEITQRGDTIVEQVQENMQLLESALHADVFWDEITELIYHKDPKEFVYDFTVPGNDSFMVDCNVLVHNTLNKVLLRTGDCRIGCCIPYSGKQCKYNYGLQLRNL
jgi:intein/homing endonuclease